MSWYVIYVSHDGDFDDSYDDVVDYIVDDFTFCRQWTLASTRGNGRPLIKMDEEGNEEEKDEKEDGGKHLGGRELRLAESWAKMVDKVLMDDEVVGEQ